MARNRPTPIPLKFKPDTRGQQGDRTCLRCRKVFLSEHRGNRICRSCQSDIDRRGVDQILETYPCHTNPRG